MPLFRNRRNRSFNHMSRSLPDPANPLGFLQAGRSAGSGGGKDTFNQILRSFYDAVVDVDRAINSIIDRLRHERAINDRLDVQANSDVRAEMARAISLADAKREELQSEISFRLQSMFIQNLITSPDQEPPVRRWTMLADLVAQKDLPAVSEPALSRLDGSPGERRRRLRRWQKETDEWLGSLCLYRVGEVIARLVEEIGDYSSAWTENVNQLRRDSTTGGRLSREVVSAESWTFENDDPTVKNLVSGVRAQETAGRILSSFQLSDTDLMDICQTVHDALGGKPVYGAERIDALELENILVEAIAGKIRDAVAIDDDFLSFATSSNGRANDDLGELLVEMRMGAAAMEERLWRVGDYRMGHVDSAAGVGITTSSIYDTVLRALGGGRRFAAVERHPSDKHRFEVQMSTVGASLSDLAIFRDMMDAWYSWHFEERRGEIGGRDARGEAVRKDSWKLYPDIGEDSGVRSAVIELIDDDLRQVWNTPGDVALRLSYGRMDDLGEDGVGTVDNSQPQLPG